MYATAEPVVSLKTSTTSASEGYLTLSWGSDVDINPPRVVTLKITEDSARDVPVRFLSFSSQTQVHLSGFSDGHYSAILLDHQNQPLSNIVQFEVRHRSLNYALILFSIGLAMFLTLLVFIVTFTRKTDKQI